MNIEHVRHLQVIHYTYIFWRRYVKKCSNEPSAFDFRWSFSIQSMVVFFSTIHVFLYYTTLICHQNRMENKLESFFSPFLLLFEWQTVFRKCKNTLNLHSSLSLVLFIFEFVHRTLVPYKGRYANEFITNDKKMAFMYLLIVWIFCAFLFNFFFWKLSMLKKWTIIWFIWNGHLLATSSEFCMGIA